MGKFMILSNITARRLLMPAAILIGLAVSTIAGAQNIPTQYLDADRKSCIDACTGGGRPADRCTAFCGCSAKAYGEALTLEEYTAISNAIKAGQEPPKDPLAKMNAVSRQCRPELGE
jgi:hypothetical protein